MVGERRLHDGAPISTPPADDRAAKTKTGLLNPTDEALGRGRGDFYTKRPLSCDGRDRPLSVVVPAGQRNEASELEAVLDAIRHTRGAPRGKFRSAA